MKKCIFVMFYNNKGVDVLIVNSYIWVYSYFRVVVVFVFELE